MLEVKLLILGAIRLKWVSFLRIVLGFAGVVYFDVTTRRYTGERESYSDVYSCREGRHQMSEAAARQRKNTR